MTVESGVYTLLSTSAAVAAAAGVALEALPDRILRAGAAKDIPAPCLVVRWEEPSMFGNLGTPRFTLRAHDRGQSYDVVSAMLDAAKGVLTAVVHQQGITQIDWMGRSPDLVDDGYGTLTKFDTYVAPAGLSVRGA